MALAQLGAWSVIAAAVFAFSATDFTLVPEVGLGLEVVSLKWHLLKHWVVHLIVKLNALFDYRQRTATGQLRWFVVLYYFKL